MTRSRLMITAGILVFAVAGYLLLLFTTAALDPTAAGPIVRMDFRIAKLFLQIRTPTLVRFFISVTAFGYWGVLFLLAGSASLVMWLYRRTRYVPGLWLDLIGNQITVNLLKALFIRQRPEFAIYPESSAAFPSGHSAASVAVFGFLTYVLIRERIGPRWIVGTTGVLIILMVGLSRLYLGEHFLSDVLTGYLVGGLWLFLGICVTEWQQTEAPTAIRPWRSAALVVVLACAAIALWFIAQTYQTGLIGTVPSAP